jgi:hypothetical protein
MYTLNTTFEVPARIRELQEIEDLAAEYEGRKPVTFDLHHGAVYDAVYKEQWDLEATHGSEDAAIRALDVVLQAQSGGYEGVDYSDTWRTFRKSEEQSLIDEKIAQLASQQKEDLVRGALLCCSYGSHLRMLNLCTDHGVYVCENPHIRASDAVAGGEGVSRYNIGWFGHCSSPTSPPTKSIRLRPYSPVDGSGTYRQAPVDATKDDCQCEPWFQSVSWRNTDERAAVTPYATHATNAHYDVATTQSYILCKHGGIVYPLTSGQQVYSVFSPAFSGCPFPEDRSAGSNFMKWCEEEAICPYWPGSDEYDDWYVQKLDALKASGEFDWEKKDELIRQRDELQAGIIANEEYRQAHPVLGAGLNDYFTAAYDSLASLDRQIDNCNKGAEDLYHSWMTGNVQLLGAEVASQRIERHGFVRDTFYEGRDNAPSAAAEILAAKEQFGTLDSPIYQK